MVVIYNNINLTSAEKAELENRLKTKIIYSDVPEIKSDFFEDEEFALYEENLNNSLYT